MGRPGPPGVSMRERFLRNEMLLGPRAMERLAAAHVCVIGLGGVGSYAVEALARAGVGELTLVDQDVYGESNLNRQLGALYSTLGQSKAEVLARRVGDINPDCAVHPVVGRYAGEDRERFSAMYCGLCRTLSRRCGRAASLILNYDFTFLAVLLAEGEPGEPHHGRCPAHPWAGRDYFPHSGAMDLAADCSVILAWWQLRDDIQDGGGPSLKSRSAALPS